mmetsp:Transcript_22052/g.38747  ORF Transcript_22052/g.38747 Transcript_22052/m.38747 type:complete len:321 (-) Transcript_22052:148-1110(-)
MAFFTLTKLSNFMEVARAAKRGLPWLAAARASAARRARRASSGSEDSCRKEKLFSKLACASSASRISMALAMASASSPRVFERSSHSASISAHCCFTSSMKEASAPKTPSVSLISCFLMARSSLVTALSSFFVSICLVPAWISADLAAANSSYCFTEAASSLPSVSNSDEKSSLSPVRTPTTPSTPSPRCRKDWKVSRSSLDSLSACLDIISLRTDRAAVPLAWRKAPASWLVKADLACSTPLRSPCSRSRSDRYSLFCCCRRSVAVSRAFSFLATSSSAFSISCFRRSLFAAKSSTRSFSSRVAAFASFTAFSFATVFS